MNPGHIIILGDFMIDVWLLVSQRVYPTSEFHGGVEPSKRVRPDLPNESAGAAGIIARTIAEFTGRGPNEIRGLGLWNPADDVRWAHVGVQIRGVPTQDAKFTLFPLKTPPKTPLVTTFKTRVFRYRGEEAPELISRIDQDPELSLPIRRRQIIPSDLGRILKGPIEAVVVADFCKGAVTAATVQQLSGCLKDSGDVPWFVESKSAKAANIFKPCTVQTFFCNQREALRLAESFGSKVDAIPRGDQPTPQLLEVGSLLLKKINARQIVITLGPDGAAVLWGKGRTGGAQFASSAPEYQSIDYPGVSAGDVFVGRWISEYLQHRRTNPQDLLRIAGQAAHRWCVYQHTEFWRDTSRDSDAPALRKAILTANLPKWTFVKPSSLRETERALARRQKYPDLLKPGDGTLRLRLKDAKQYLGDFVTTDWDLGGKLLRLQSEMAAYKKRRESSRPYVCLLHAQPGSGKTFLARELAKATGYELYELNVARLADVDRLTVHFDQIASLSARRGPDGALPLLILDEFESKLGGQYIFGHLLSPLGEGIYEVGAQQRYLGRISILVVASRKRGLKKFRRWLKRRPKGKDLWSRINGLKLELPKLSRADRVYLATALIKRTCPRVKRVQKGVLDIFANSRGASVRQIEQMVECFPTTEEVLLNDYIDRSTKASFTSILGTSFRFEVSRAQKRQVQIE